MGSKANATITLSSYRDMKSVTRYYQLSSSTPSKPTTKPPSGWSTAEPTYTSGSTLSLYFCDLIEFSDGTYAYSAVNKSSSYQAAKEAYTAAQNAKDAVDNLKVGGRNLAVGGKWTSDTESTNYVWGKISCKVNVDYNETYTLSAYRNGIRMTGNTYGYAYAYAYDSEGNRVGTGDYLVTSNVRGFHTKTISDESIAYLTLCIGSRNCVVGDEYRIKFEIGNTPTDWTPAPEDLVASVDVEYYLSTSATSLSGGSWSTTAPAWVNGKYMWSRTVKTNGAGTKTYSPSQNGVCIAGATGATGSAGKGVKSIAEQYYKSTSATSQTGGSWVSTYPGWENGKYIWTRSVITYTDNTTTTTAAICVTGSQGATGAAGKGVKSTAVTYQAGSSGTSAPTGTWVSSPPATNAANPYLWSRTVITYTDNTTSTTYSVGSTPEGVVVGGRNYIRYGKGDSANGIFSKFNTVTDSYSEHTLTSKKQYTNINIAAGFVLGCRDYVVGETVTWSYDIMYTAWNFPEGSNRGEFWFGQRYTNVPSGETGTGLWRMVTAHNLPVVGTNGCELNKWYHVEKTMTIPEQASSNVDEAASIQFYNSNADVEASFTFRLKNVKLEYGNHATDWTPALEDVATVDSLESTNQAMDELADLMNARVEATEMAIGEIEGLISTLVVDENGGSLMKQTSDGWVFSMGETLSQLQTATDDLKALKDELDATGGNVDALQNVVANLETLTSYIRITTDGDEPQIELGNEGSFKVIITNTAIKFMDGTSVPAYVTNQSLKIGKAEVEDELVFGGFAFAERANGNMGLIWKGE